MMYNPGYMQEMGYPPEGCSFTLWFYVDSLRNRRSMLTYKYVGR